MRNRLCNITIARVTSFASSRHGNSSQFPHSCNRRGQACGNLLHSSCITAALARHLTKRWQQHAKQSTSTPSSYVRLRVGRGRLRCAIVALNLRRACPPGLPAAQESATDGSTLSHADPIADNECRRPLPPTGVDCHEKWCHRR